MRATATTLTRQAIAVSVVSLGIAVGVAGSAAAESLTVVSWGGAYQDAQKAALFEPFAKAIESEIVSEEYNGGLTQIRAQIESGKIRWNVVDLEMRDAAKGCADGLFDKLDPDALGNVKDFVPGALTPCAIGSAVWSMAIAVSTTAFKDKAPVSLRDFFDVTTFPGKRGLRKSPEVALEWALIADGVPGAEVYAALATGEGLDRAFAKLDTIAAHIEWWESGNQPAEWLTEGKVAMSAAYSPRAYAAMVGGKDTEKAPIDIIWDGQVWTMSFWAVPKGARGGETAAAFLKFATSAEQQAKFATYLAYGPTRRSALTIIPEAMRRKLPTFGENMKTALRLDPVWWAEHKDTIDKRFSDWLAKGFAAAKTE